jgi:hypothetical protein
MKNEIKHSFILSYAFLLVACGGGGSDGTVVVTPDGNNLLRLPTQISWTEPQQNNDNSELVNFWKYRFYYGPTESTLTHIPEMDILATQLNPPQNAKVTYILTPSDIETLTLLAGGDNTHYYAVTSLNKENVESGFSYPISQFPLPNEKNYY